MSFSSLGLSNALLKAISKKGYNTPTVIQDSAIPQILKGKDILASAQTGSGKTAGFALPILQLLSKEKKLHKRPVRSLILTPTRELAAQVRNEIREYAEFTDLRSAVIFGGVGAGPQIRTLRQGVDILVATPGRLLDLHDQKVLSLASVEILVLDEADRMLDMGFIRDINRILALLPKRKQSLLFSATFSKEIKKLAASILYKPVMVEATPENTAVEIITQRVYKTDKRRKTELLTKLISEGNWQQVLVFMRTKHGANKLSHKLERAGISSTAIHGNKTQGARTRALDGFKKGKVRVLVATDIAARGLDINLLPHVVNYELPNIPEDYVHRIGRTGRAGASGEAISIVSVDEYQYLRDIEKLLNQRLENVVIPGFETTETLKEVLDKKAENKANNQRGRQNARSKNTNKSKHTNKSRHNRGRRKK
jgi:ATP-dependent RNA helicase RhlE